MPIVFDTRKATENDIDDLAELFCQHGQYILDEGFADPSTRDVNWVKTDEGLATMRKYAPGDDEYCSWIAISDDKPVGMLLGHIFSAPHRLDNPLGEIDNIYIAAGYRCSGIGTALMEDFTLHCKPYGVTRIKAQTFVANKHARNVYERQGMEEVEVTYEIRCD